jgi:hypothetical protein
MNVDGMPSVTVRTVGTDGKQETLTEYICDWPDCPNVAEHVIGVVRELHAMSMVCTEHKAIILQRRR